MTSTKQDDSGQVALRDDVSKHNTRGSLENAAKQKVLLIGKRDLEKNSVISRSTKGGFKSSKKNQIQIYDPDAGFVKTNFIAPKKVELDEEEYFDTLEKIIQRDFFPNLYKPQDSNGMKDSPSSKSRMASQSNMSLNEFLRRYSSEDNIAFEDLQEKDRQRFMNKISWMFDESAKFNKLNQLALEHGHKNQAKTGRPNFLISSADAPDQVGSQNTRSVPQIGYNGKSEPMSTLFFNQGHAGGFEHQRMLVSEQDHESKKVLKENTRFEQGFIEKQQAIENNILNPNSKLNLKKLGGEGFKVPKPKYKVQGIKAREAIGLYLADNTVTAKKKREAKALEKGSNYMQGSESALRSLRQGAPGQNLISNLNSNQSERSFRTQMSKMSKASRLSQGSVKSTTSIKNQISAMSVSGQSLLKNVMKKRRPDSMSQF